MTRALAEAWARPSDLAKAAIRLICADHAVQGCIERASQAWPSMLGAKELFGPTGLATLANDFLLQQLLEGAQVCDLALERLLIMVRHVAADAATEAVAHDGLEDRILVLLRHCATMLYQRIRFLLYRPRIQPGGSTCAKDWSRRCRSGDPVSPLWIVAVASYSSLSSLPADILLHRSWPDPGHGAVEATRRRAIGGTALSRFDTQTDPYRRRRIQSGTAAVWRESVPALMIAGRQRGRVL